MNKEGKSMSTRQLHTHEEVTVVGWTADGPRSRQECRHCGRAWLSGMEREGCAKREQAAAQAQWPLDAVASGDLW